MRAYRIAALTVLMLITAGATRYWMGNDDRKFASHATVPEGMAYIPSGTYEPLYETGSEDDSQQVEPFYIERLPVTNAQYLEFVRANPRWQRSNIPTVFADDGYLSHWAGDTSFAPELADSPVINVSWFAARAYADWKGMRLPTTAEWEVVAMASEESPAGMEDPAYRARIIDWYSRPRNASDRSVGSVYENHYGVWDMHGLVWEWVEDFNEGIVSADSRENVDMDLKLFCGSGSIGAADVTDYAGFIRFAFRAGLEARYTVRSLGFRVAADIPHILADVSE